MRDRDDFTVIHSIFNYISGYVICNRARNRIESERLTTGIRRTFNRVAGEADFRAVSRRTAGSSNYRNHFSFVLIEIHVWPLRADFATRCACCEIVILRNSWITIAHS